MNPLPLLRCFSSALYPLPRILLSPHGQSNHCRTVAAEATGTLSHHLSALDDQRTALGRSSRYTTPAWGFLPSLSVALHIPSPDPASLKKNVPNRMQVESATCKLLITIGRDKRVSFKDYNLTMSFFGQAKMDYQRIFFSQITRLRLLHLLSVLVKLLRWVSTKETTKPGLQREAH